MKVIVTGSLGNISKPLAMALVANGHDVTVISSSADKQKNIEAIGAKAAIGSLVDVGFVTSAFTGTDVVYAMIPPNYAATDSRQYYRTIGNSYAEAIKQTGVKKVVHLSSWGADLSSGTGPILGSHDVEEILNELSPEVAVTHLRATSFYSNFYMFVGMIKSVGFMGTNYGGDVKLTLAHHTDIAAAAVEEIEAHTNGIKVRYVASDESTPNHITQVIGAAIGKPDLKWVAFSDEDRMQALVQRGMGAKMAADLVDLSASINSGLLRQDYDLHKPAVMGKVKIEDFAKEFAAVFNKA